MSFNKAPMARKLAPSASTGLSIPLISLKPLKKYFKFITKIKKILIYFEIFYFNHFIKVLVKNSFTSLVASSAASLLYANVCDLLTQLLSN